MKNPTLPKTILILLLSLSTLGPAEVLWAKNLYIGDTIYVPLRRGQGSEFGIVHRGLPTGTRVTLVERGQKWTKVTTQRGLTGWLPNQYLQDEPPASARLVTAREQLTALEDELQSVKSDKVVLEASHAELSQALEASVRREQETAAELASIQTISAAAVESHQRLQSLVENMQLLQTENDVLTAENENLQRSQRNTFFLYGAFTLLLGIIVAIIVPRLRVRKRNDGWLN